ncbi:MBL fold metallo-hydrolase [Pelagibacterium limicola]|uniref:MBL fold metallo-hydrolase n=1 Tax=Pelagibacterium limicola TaxID=2791022 RepID=UPI0018AFECD0|nr:MBL fold metallo-hydrolase [Pelagibacterium limicola]
MFERDEIETAKGPLAIIPVHHASLVLEWNGETIFCDPVGGAGRYAALERPTLIVLTHHHDDHLDFETLDALISDETALVAPKRVYDQMPADIAARTKMMMANGDEAKVCGVRLKAIPMYNTTPERAKYHEKGVGNGYLFDFAGTKVYLASDTEPIPEMDDLGPVDIAFLPMNLPYTMTPDQVVTCIGKVEPRAVYPFHYGFASGEIGTQPQELSAALPPGSRTEIRIRDWYPDR